MCLLHVSDVKMWENAAGEDEDELEVKTGREEKCSQTQTQRTGTLVSPVSRSPTLEIITQRIMMETVAGSDGWSSKCCTDTHRLLRKALSSTNQPQTLWLAD